MLIGQYDLWVRKGAVSVFGGLFHASSELHRIYAPSTHALPKIKAIPNPFDGSNQAAEVTLLSCSSRVRLLKNVLSKFVRIWNRTFQRETEEATENFLPEGLSFSLVGVDQGDERRVLIVRLDQKCVRRSMDEISPVSRNAIRLDFIHIVNGV